MSDLSPILGFRKDRIGARLIGLLNLLRLGRKFGVPVRFLWLSQPEGPYPELADPCEFLAADFVARNITVIGQPPELAGRENLAALASTLDAALVAERLAAGRRFFSDAAFDAIAFMGEPLSDARAEIAAIAAELPLAPPLARALTQAQNRLARLVPGGLAQASAIHMRRGDLLDGIPWSLGAWPAKYVPDEFFRAWAAMQPGGVIVFTDTPAAARHMAGGNPHILPIDRLLDLERLTATERDMLELLLMGRCQQIGAPGGSAFSSAAAALGMARITALPHGLPEAERALAHQALLERAIAAPDSFFAPGDLAQSLHYASRHAIATGQAGRLVDALADSRALMAAHPFTRRILAECAQAAGRQDQARALALRALEDPRLAGRDRGLCRGIVSAVRARAAPDGEETRDDFLAALFSQVAGRNAQLAQMAVMLLSRDGPVSRALMFPRDLLPQLLGGNDIGQPVLAPWFYLADWDELLGDDNARRPLLAGPPIHLKLRPLGPALRAAEAALTAGATPPPPGDEAEAARLGLGAAILSLHGRYARALRVLHWLDEIRPGDALTRKRLADTCYRIGNAERADAFMQDALRLAGGPPLMLLSMARRQAELRRPARARKHLLQAGQQWPGSVLLRQQARRIERLLAADPVPGAG